MKIEHAIQLAEHLCKREGVKAKITIDAVSKNAGGDCKYSSLDMVNKYNIRIRLSKWLVEANTDDIVLNIILHEIAHAIAPVGAGHNAAWRSVCKQLGMTHISRFVEEGIKGSPAHKWHGVCPICSMVFKRRRLTKHMRSGYCTCSKASASTPLMWIESKYCSA